MIRYVYEKEHPDDSEVKRNIRLARSDSGCCGAELRQVHFQMGMHIGSAITDFIDMEDVVVVALLKGAIPFAFGVGEIIDVKLLMIDSHSDNELPAISEKTIIILDEVINSGKTVLKIADHYKDNHRVILATTVMPDDSEALDTEYSIFTYRISKHRYKGALVKKIEGSKGPDTSARLYSLF